jgi:serine/threonine protein kinase
MKTVEGDAEFCSTHVYSPFVVSCKFVLHSATTTRIFLDYVHGGELFKLLHRRCNFTEREARFYTAEILLALEHLHTYGPHNFRLRPKKILLDSYGHIALSDFGLSAIDDSNIGVEKAYAAPETFLKGHAKCTENLWVLGVLLFEMGYGFNPFYHLNSEETEHNVLFGKGRQPQNGFLKTEGRNLICSLLRRNPKHRLG